MRACARKRRATLAPHALSHRVPAPRRPDATAAAVMPARVMPSCCSCSGPDLLLWSRASCWRRVGGVPARQGGPGITRAVPTRPGELQAARTAVMDRQNIFCLQSMAALFCMPLSDRTAHHECGHAEPCTCGCSYKRALCGCGVRYIHLSGSPGLPSCRGSRGGHTPLPPIPLAAAGAGRRARTSVLYGSECVEKPSLRWSVKRLVLRRTLALIVELVNRQRC
jgi:hypothetical protein